MIASLIRVHYRLGFTRVILFVDMLFLFLVSIDIVNYTHQGLSLGAAAQGNNLPMPYPLGRALFAFLIFLALLLPSVAAIAKVAGVPGFVHINPASKPSRVLAIHLILCVFFISFSVFAERMEMISGWRQFGSKYTTEFQSIFRILVTSSIFATAITALASAAGAGFTALVGYLLIGRESTKSLKQYETRAMLADLPSDLRTRQLKPSFAMTTIGDNQVIPATNTLIAQMNKTYYDKDKSRSQRVSFVENLLVESRRLFLDNVTDNGTSATQPSHMDTECFEVFVDQNGAWESAIRNAPPHDLVIIGPYATSAVTRSIEACCLATGSKTACIQLDPEDYYASWQQQEKAILAQVKNVSVGSESSLIIIGHVSYATGLITPLRDFARKIQQNSSAKSIYIIVDGSNAVGNRCKVPLRDPWDAYVFYPHRWLLASERASMLITKNSSNSLPKISLNANPARHDDAFRAIASLRASLEVISRPGLDYYWKRSHALRNAFVNGLPRSFQIVGSQSGLDHSFIVSCYPSGSSAWRHGIQTLNDALGKVCASASIVSVDENKPWVRLNLPYYLDPRELNRINNFLEQNTSD